jgi:hypothetical protein
MALDFTTGVLDPRVTVTRALNTATRVNSSGLVEIVNANLPRFDYNPSTLAPRGLLIEEARTNLMLQSSDFGNVLWTKSNATITSDAITSPDGTLTADKLVENTATNSHFVFQNSACATATSYTYTVFAKKGERNFLSIFCINTAAAANTFFNLNTGVVVSTSAGATSSITPFGNGWYRCSVTTTTTSVTTGIYAGVSADGINSNYTGDGTSGIYLWGAQLEAGAFATSYIPTTTTSLTRNADAVSMTGTNFSDWYNASEGSFYARGSRNNDASFSALVAVSSDASNEMYMTQTSSRAFAFIRSSAGVNGDLNGQVNSWIGGTVGSAVFAYKLNNAALAVNANSTITDTTVTIPTVNRLDIGARSNGTFMNGHIQRVSYWPQRLIDAEAQAFSKG